MLTLKRLKNGFVGISFRHLSPATKSSTKVLENSSIRNWAAVEPLCLCGGVGGGRVMAQDRRDGLCAEGFGTLLLFEHLPLCSGFTI